jgi:Lon protease-like protein
LPLRDIVIFPHMVVPLFVGREKSLGALGEATARGENQEIFLSAQRWPEIPEPAPNDIFQVGTLANLIQVLHLPDGTVKVLVEGKQRATIRNFVDSEGFFAVEVEEIKESDERSAETTAASRALLAAFESFIKLSKGLAPELIESVHSIESPGELADTIAGQLQLKLAASRPCWKWPRPLDRILRLSELLRSEIEVLQAERKLRGRPRRSGRQAPRRASGKRSRRWPGPKSRASATSSKTSWPSSKRKPRRSCSRRGCRQGQEGDQKAAHDGAHVGRGRGGAWLHRLDFGPAVVGAYRGPARRGRGRARARP